MLCIQFLVIQMDERLKGSAGTAQVASFVLVLDRNDL